MSYSEREDYVYKRDTLSKAFPEYYTETEHAEFKEDRENAPGYCEEAELQERREQYDHTIAQCKRRCAGK